MTIMLMLTAPSASGSDVKNPLCIIIRPDGGDGDGDNDDGDYDDDDDNGDDDDFN
jgi:hypothetical protein